MAQHTCRCQPRRMRLTRNMLGVALGSLLLSACGSGDVTVARGAVSQGGRLMDSGLSSVKLTADDVDALAVQVNVSEDVIRDVAPTLDEQPVWRRAIGGVTTVYRQTPEQVRSNLIGIACEGVTGQIESQAALQQNVQERFQVSTQDELTQLVNAVLGLWQSLYDASISEDADIRAAAAIACFTVEQLAG